MRFSAGTSAVLPLACSAFAGLCISASTLFGANATVLDTDPNADGLGFGKTDAFAYGGVYSLDAGAVFNGNDILVQTQAGAAGGTGAGISVPVSNGENGRNQSLDGGSNQDVNLDVANAVAPNPVFATIGNTPVTDPLHGQVAKLQNGNVLRYSMWVREDPNNPITAAPQIEPVIKFEFWKEALSTNADSTGGVPQPSYGDKIVDTDQHLGQGIWLDLNKNGSVIDGAAAGQGRIRTVNTTSWTLIEASYTVNDADWWGIGDDLYTVADVEEVRAVMFWGDFISTNLGGSLWFDNLQFEVFANAGAVTPNTNPNPTLSEGVASADFNDNGIVDGADFLAWQRGFGKTTGALLTNGDADNDGDVDANDLTVWKNQFGTPGAAPAVASIPEPATLALAAVTSLCVGAVCRRRR